MAAAVQVLGYVVSAGFLGLGLLTLRDWLRQPNRRRGYLAVAIGLLSVVSLVSQFDSLTSGRYSAVLGPITLLFFMASGYGLLLFRGTFIPLTRVARSVALAASVAATAFVLLIGLPQGNAQPMRTETLAIFAYVLVWTALVAEPIVRFWLASIGRPGVQRARLRVLSGGFAAIAFILLVSGFAGQAASSLGVQFALQLVALATVPLLYASFAPPRWLRRFWREAEEEELRRGTRDLLLFSADRASLAGRSLEWGLRLVGSDAGAVIDGDQVLAIRGMDASTALGLARSLDAAKGERLYPVSETGMQNALAIPLGLDRHWGAVVVVSGAFMPLFGSDEVLRFEQFAANLSLALDRVRVVERMSELERSKTQFLNLASHELRTPLSVIRGYLSMIDAGSLGTLNTAGRRAMTVLSAKALEMNMLIDQMLEAARLEEGRLALRIERVDLGEVASAAIELVTPLADPQHPLILEGADEDIAVMADRNRVTTILTNLLDNAIKYSPEGGPVRCTVRRSPGSAVVQVRDQGLGIGTAGMAELFTRFGRVLTDETRHIKGTGLGLYLSRELARQMGGDITVESRLGEGSTFTLQLPLAAPAVADVPKARPRPRVLESTGTDQS